MHTKSCQVAPLLAVGRNGILVRGFGGQIPPTEQTASFEGQVEAERAMSAECPPALKAPPLAAGIFTRGVGGKSPANVAQYLSGVDFSWEKDDLVYNARQNGAGGEGREELRNV